MIKNKRGVSLVETLASIVITASLLLLMSTIIQSFLRTHSEVLAEGSLSIENELITKKIKNDMFYFNPLDVTYCESGGVQDVDCIQFSREMGYQYDPQTDLIEFVAINPPDYMKIHFASGEIYFDDVLFAVNGYSIHPDSTFNITNEIDGNKTLTIDLILQKDGSNETYSSLATVVVYVPSLA